MLTDSDKQWLLNNIAKPLQDKWDEKVSPKCKKRFVTKLWANSYPQTTYKTSNTPGGKDQ